MCSVISPLLALLQPGAQMRHEGSRDRIDADRHHPVVVVALEAAKAWLVKSST
jgi:hypothetical protein